MDGDMDAAKTAAKTGIGNHMDNHIDKDKVIDKDSDKDITIDFEFEKCSNPITNQHRRLVSARYIPPGIKPTSTFADGTYWTGAPGYEPSLVLKPIAGTDPITLAYDTAEKHEQQHSSLRSCVEAAVNACTSEWSMIGLFRITRYVIGHAITIPGCDVVAVRIALSPDWLTEVKAKQLIAKVHAVLVTAQLSDRVGIDLAGRHPLRTSAGPKTFHTFDNLSNCFAGTHHQLAEVSPWSGTSIGVARSSPDDASVSGTLGPFLRLVKGDGAGEAVRYLALTCHHVVSKSRRPVDSKNAPAIECPSPQDRDKYITKYQTIIKDDDKFYAFDRQKVECDTNCRFPTEHVNIIYRRAQEAKLAKQRINGIVNSDFTLGVVLASSGKPDGNLVDVSTLDDSALDGSFDANDLKPHLDWAVVEFDPRHLPDVKDMTNAVPFPILGAIPNRDVMFSPGVSGRCGVVACPRALMQRKAVVFKTGRTTGTRFGYVNGSLVTTRMETITVDDGQPPVHSYIDSRELAVVSEVDTDTFSFSGDSGSTVFDASGAVVGMLWAGDQTRRIDKRSDGVHFVTPIAELLREVGKALGGTAELL